MSKENRFQIYALSSQIHVFYYVICHFADISSKGSTACTVELAGTPLRSNAEFVSAVVVKSRAEAMIK